ncbi:MAG: hypothetical protein M3Z11_07200 [Candidatus Dormibacteraeota bacterium]|nr:hypothetical protein [Candidatus Dormibacteraeota bacterium]
MTESLEQLRRLKNTVMGAANRLALLGRSGELPPEADRELRMISGELADVARRLERMLTGLGEKN